MSKLGDFTVRACNSMGHTPSAILCCLLVCIQAATLDYYLVHHLDLKHFLWIFWDIIVITLFAASFHLTSRFESDRKYVIVWMTWLTLQVLLAAKVIVICTNFSTDLDEESSTFFGPNTLKTAIALSSCIFVLLLTSQHDAPLASERRRYIEELTGTVVFDILDTADILEILFDEKDRPSLSSGLPEVVLSVATLNLLLPTVPLITLSKSKFGLDKLRRKWIYLHRLLVVLAVNVPNLVLRMSLWHVYSVAVSPFTLKNIILIFMTLYEFYEHKKEKYEEHERESFELEQRREQNKGDSNQKGQNQNQEDITTCGKQGDTNNGAEVTSFQHSCDNSDGEASEKDAYFDIESRFVTGL